MSKFLLISVIIQVAFAERNPLYKYRYETQDVMKTSASEIPLRGYHLVEGGYYPSAGRFRGDFDNFEPRFRSKYSNSGYNGFSSFNTPSRILGDFSRSHHYIPHHNLGGEIIDKKIYADDHKHLNDEKYEKAHGKKGEVLDHDEEGFNKDRVDLKESKEDSGYYNDQNGGKKVYEDGKTYSGGQHFNQEGNNGSQQKDKKGHKKGHKIKGFKTSHHKDESGKTEEFYDEENDESDNANFNGKSGNFGEKAQSAFNGGQQNDQYDAGEHKKQGHFDNSHAVGKSNTEGGSYGKKKYSGSGQVYGVNNGVDESSLLGHQESSRIFKSYPYHVPFYSY